MLRCSVDGIDESTHGMLYEVKDPKPRMAVAS